MDIRKLLFIVSAILFGVAGLALVTVNSFDIKTAYELALGGLTALAIGHLL
jgi:hypothetical protein